LPLKKEDDQMKTRPFVTLLAFIGLTLSAFAQQTTSSTPPAASTASPAMSATTDPLPEPRSRDFWDGDDPSLAALIFHPFASKAYVKRHVQPIRDRLAELDELTVSNQQMTRDVDARAQQGLHMASDKASLADTHATDATNKALMAQQTATALSARVSADETLVGNIDQYKAGSQTELQFRRGQTALSKQAKDALDAMAAPLKGQRGYLLEVQGFSSGQGQAAIENSKKMADSVVRYLVLNHEIPTYRIYVIGMGNVSPDMHASGTRVEISLLKNDLEQTAKQ
jgi:outer membrane protein OmpA-like peptidoglycan-associated protein